MHEEAVVRLKLDVLLKQADLFQSEMDKRLERHAQSFYFCTLLLAGVVTGAATLREKASIDVLLSILVFLPFLTTPLAAMFFDDELLRGVSDYHFHHHVVPEIRSLLADTGSTGKDIMNGTLTARFAFMREALITEHHVRVGGPRWAANSRRFIFVVPFLFAAAALVFAITDVSGRQGQAHVNDLTKLVSIFGGGVDACLLFVTVQMWRPAAAIWKAITRKPSRRAARAKASFPA